MAPSAHYRGHKRLYIQASSANGSVSGHEPGKNDATMPLLSYEEIPAWYQDNDCIRHGYRPVMNSVSACFRSLTYIHNETANIYSHLFPAVFSIVSQGLVYKYFSWHYPEASQKDRLIIAFHLCTAAVCLGLSASYHTLMNHSAHYSDLWGRTDHAGILVLILGDFVSGIYVGFYCEPKLQKLYWSMIILLGSITTFIVVHPSFQHRRYRLFRLASFILTGLSAFAPIIHAARIFPLEQLNKQSGLPYYYAEGALILLGALVYATRFPEVIRPGRFDIWGSSHQIFHVLVVMATIIHLLGVLSAFNWNFANRRCAAASL